MNRAGPGRREDNALAINDHDFEPTDAALGDLRRRPPGRFRHQRRD